MMFACCGKPGNGKTLLLIKKFYELHLLGYPIYSNMHNIKIPHKTYKSLEELKTFKNAGAIVDEIAISADARRSLSDFNTYFSQYMNQHRKKNIIIGYTVQKWQINDWRIREITDIAYFPKFYEVDGMQDDNGNDISIVEYVTLRYDEISGWKKIPGTTKFIGNIYYPLFDTLEEIEPLTIFSDGCNTMKEHKKHLEKDEKLLIQKTEYQKMAKPLEKQAKKLKKKLEEMGILSPS